MRAIRLPAAGAAFAAMPGLMLAGLMLAGAMPQPARAQAAPPAATPPAAPPPAAAKPAGDPVVAKVGDQEVHLSDLSAAAQALPAEMRGLPPGMLYPLLLNQAIDRIALIEMARKQGLDKDPAVQAEMRRAADQALQTALVTRVIGPQLSEAAIKARYDRDIAGKPGEEEVHARHILVASEAEAKKIIAELDKGADFAKLAKEHSTDPGAADGGDLGFFKKGDMVPEFADAAFALKPGEYTKTPVKSQFGWHIIKVEARRQGKPPTFEQAHDELRQQMISEDMKKLLAEAHQGLKVEKFNPDGSKPNPLDSAAPAPAPAPAKP